jgi:hypothetical protein
MIIALRLLGRLTGGVGCSQMATAPVQQVPARKENWRATGRQ